MKKSMLIIVGLIGFATLDVHLWNAKFNQTDVNVSVVLPEAPVLEKPAAAPPAQDRYLIILQSAPEYHVIPLGYPPEYYRCPQLYFYYEPCAPYFRPGVSVFIGCGWWYTPGCGLINIGWYHPHQRPFPICNNTNSKVIVSNTNISNTQTTINVNKINNINITNNNQTPPAPPKPQTKVEPKSQPKQAPVDPKAQPKTQPKVEPKAQPKQDPKVQPKVEPKAQPKQDPKVQPKVEPKTQPKVLPPRQEPKVEPRIPQQPKVEPKQPNPGPRPKVESKPNQPERKDKP